MQEARIYSTPESSILAGNEVPAYADIAFSAADIAFFIGRLRFKGGFAAVLKKNRLQVISPYATQMMPVIFAAALLRLFAPITS